MGSAVLDEALGSPDASPTAPATSSRRRRRLAGGAAVGVVALAVLAAVLLSSSSPSHPATGTGVPPGETTTSVARTTLTESTTLDGTLGYRGSAELYDRLASAGTFTWLPAVGAVVARGGTLFRVNNMPVLLMYGAVPAYRALAQGVSEGPDVEQLNENLLALGFDPYGAINDHDSYGEATAAAVRRLQKADGLSQTGKVELGRVVFATGAQRVTKLHVALGQDPPGSGEEETPAKEAPAKETPAKESPAKEQPAKAAPAKEKPAKKGPAKETPANKTPAKEKPAKEQPAEKAPAKEAPASEAPAKNGEGAGGGAGTLVLSTTSTQQVVQLQVKANQQQLAHVGEYAPVTLPDGRIVHGHITEVGTVAAEAESEAGKGGSGNGGAGNGESATIAVTLTLDHRVARLDKAPVSVQLVKAVRSNVLAVPATALTATGGGGYAIETLLGNRRVEVPVTPGMFADGYVQVEGEGVREGMTVLESR